ncbi:hypothetical protein GCM10018953_09280 [Streptosporangium nondiastaticum]
MGRKPRGAPRRAARRFPPCPPYGPRRGARAGPVTGAGRTAGTGRFSGHGPYSGHGPVQRREKTGAQAPGRRLFSR